MWYFCPAPEFPEGIPMSLHPVTLCEIYGGMLSAPIRTETIWIYRVQYKTASAKYNDCNNTRRQSSFWVLRYIVHLKLIDYLSIEINYN